MIIRESSPFGLILLLLIGSSITDALRSDNRSITNGVLLAVSLTLIHVLVAYVKRDNKKIMRIIDDVPTVLVQDGQIFKDRLLDARVTEGDVLMAARRENISKVGEIKYAILEIDGSISVIPKEKES